jgi:hypothetical protein
LFFIMAVNADALPISPSPRSRFVLYLQAERYEKSNDN